MCSTTSSLANSFLLVLLLALSSSSSHAIEFPNLRHLSQLAAQGDLEDRLHVKFNPPQSSTTTTSSSNTTTTKEANLDNDSDQEDAILWERANDILQNVLSDDCHAVERLFRPAGRFEDAHREAGLTRWFVYDCSTNNSTTNTTQDPPEEDGDDSGTQATETSGHMAVSALTKLQEWFDHIDDPNQDSVWSMEFVTAEHKVEETVLAGSRQDIPISTRDQALETGPTGLSTSTTSAIPNDPLLSFQDHYDAIQLPAAWQIMTDSNAWPQCKNVVVQVLDSGWDTDHVDSGVNQWTNPGEDCSGAGSGNGIDDDNNGFVDDCHGYNHGDRTSANLVGSSNHGSHCTGTIGATTDNDLGVAGVAGGRGNHPGVSILTSVGFGRVGSRGFAEAIVYGADMGSHISSNSWGYTSPNVADRAVLEAISFATSREVLVVFAAGNSNSNQAFYPAFSNEVVAVAATDNTGAAASFTNYGSWVDIAAPGVRIASTGLSASQPSVNSDEYLYLSGTSMACPHVSGVLALGKCLNPSATSAELKGCLLNTATPLNSNRDLGRGMVNPPEFLKCVQTIATDSSPTVSPTQSPTDKPSTATPTSTPTSNPTAAPANNQCRVDQCQEATPDIAGCASCRSCQEAVCEADAFCCGNEWDGLCVIEARDLCPCPCARNEDECTSGCGNCRQIRSNEQGCSCESCRDQVCALAPDCCTQGWGLLCAVRAVLFCDTCTSSAASTTSSTKDHPLDALELKHKDQEAMIAALFSPTDTNHN